MLSNLSIKQKLILIMIVPLIVVILLTAKVAYTSFSNTSNLTKLDKVVVLSTKLGALVHETQKERGMTAGYLGSKGKKFKTELPLQRQNVDKRFSELKEFLKDFDKTAYTKEFENNLNQGLNQLSTLERTRDNVDRLNIKLPSALGYYTKANALFLNTVGTISTLSTDPVISQELVSYLNFLLSKERAGIERAVGTNTFAKNSFGKGMKAKFYTLIAAQNAYMDSFLKVADSTSKEFYKSTVRGNPIDEVNKMRKIALYNGLNNDFGVDAKYWFTTITKKINLLKKVENFLADKLLKSINRELSNAQTELTITTILSFIAIALTMILARSIAFTILKDVESLKNGVENFFAFVNFKKSDSELIEIKSKDELGKMSKLINDNILMTKTNIQKDKELIQDTIRVANEINKGHLDTKISLGSNNPALNDLKDIINEMLETLNKNIGSTMAVLASYSRLDYRPRVPHNNLEGVIKELEDDVNMLGDVITETLVENKRIGLVLSQNAHTLTKNMQDISDAANSQAASLEETAAALEEITANITNNTETTSKMASFGENVKVSAAEGQKLASNTATSMEEINEHTSSITEAITVIDQIAFQTNILSLNAAVEAATAGEAGKGFAVVAGEVRNLAGRSAEAAKEIKELVENAQNKTFEGKNNASKMIEGYNQLNANITQTLDLIENVSTASKEQTDGIVQINDTVSKLDAITQENAQHAMEADAIAKQTLSISDTIIDHADSKEFDGKHNIKIRKNSVNLDFDGNERRVAEKELRKINKNSKRESFAPPKKEKPSNQIITSRSSEDDEWESF